MKSQENYTTHKCQTRAYEITALDICPPYTTGNKNKVNVMLRENCLFGYWKVILIGMVVSFIFIIAISVSRFSLSF